MSTTYPPKPPDMSFSDLQVLHLTPNGWSIVEPQPLDFFNHHNRVYVEKGNESFPLHFQPTYKWLQIYHLLKQLDFGIPKEYIEYYEYQRSIKGKRYELDIDKDDNAKKDTDGG